MKNKMIRAAIENASRDAGLKPEVGKEISFHMTDWLKDLEDWHQFCKNPESLGSSELQRLLISFLNHVPEHVAAARKLYLDFPVEDTFDVGIFDIGESGAEA